MLGSHVRYLSYVSGERRGLLAGAVRAGLSALSVPYRLACGIRMALYNNGLLACRELDAPVISVGNITAGGTGKTPLVVWTVRWLLRQGVRPAILSRGYGEKARPPKGGTTNGGTANGGDSDETLLYRRQAPGVPHVVDSNRYRGGLRAIAEHGAECLVLDDGFQHLALGRDLDVVAVDALAPFGYGRLLPRGLLREPLKGLRRADLIVLTRCDQAAREQVREVVRQVRALGVACPIAESEHRPACIREHPGSGELELGWLLGRRVWAFSALGNPAAFVRSLQALGAEVLGHEAYRDHHWYQPEELEAIARRAVEAGAEAVVTTEKDAVKLGPFPEGAPPAFVLAVELAVTRGEEFLVRALDKALSG